MKPKLFFILIVSAATFVNVHAQTGKGSFMIGGSSSFVRSQDHNESGFSTVLTPTSTFSVSPTVGYFLLNNFMAGVQTSLALGWRPGEPDVKSRTYTIGPVLRYYFPFGKFAVFPEVAGVYNFQKIHYVIGGSPITPTQDGIKYSSYRAGAGIAWFVSPNIGIEGIIAYRQNNFLTQGGWQSQLYANIGIQFYLPKKD